MRALLTEVLFHSLFIKFLCFPSSVVVLILCTFDALLQSPGLLQHSFGFSFELFGLSLQGLDVFCFLFFLFAQDLQGPVTFDSLLLFTNSRLLVGLLQNIMVGDLQPDGLFAHAPALQSAFILVEPRQVPHQFDLVFALKVSEGAHKTTEVLWEAILIFEAAAFIAQRLPEVVIAALLCQETEADRTLGNVFSAMYGKPPIPTRVSCVPDFGHCFEHLPQALLSVTALIVVPGGAVGASNSNGV